MTLSFLRLRAPKPRTVGITEIRGPYYTPMGRRYLEDPLVRLVEHVRKAGLKAKPEVGIQFGAGGASRVAELESQGVQDVGRAIRLARRYLDAGASLIMIESEGITESVRTWRTDAISQIAGALGLEKVMFEAADPDVFEWYVTNCGPEVNLFVDHSQIVRLECLRAGLWGTKNLWGRVVTYKPRASTPRPTRSPRRTRGSRGAPTRPPPR
jgi:phosphosulfolactate synthase (CoM biosynthesis protein A)